MKIALVTNGIWPYVMGGMQRHSYYLCKYLARNGIEVDLYHLNRQDKYDINQLEFFTKEEKKNINNIVVPPVEPTDSFPGHYIRTSKKQSEAIYQIYLNNNNKVDFIYTKGLAGWKFIQEKSKGISMPPVSVKVHGYEMYQIAPSLKVKFEHFLLRPIFKYINRNADYIFSYGGKITDIITNRLSISKDRIIEIPTGIGENWLSQNHLKANQPVKFTFLGRYERRKGIKELSNILEQMKDEFKFKFEFIGPIPENKRVNSPRIKYHGLITNQDKIQSILQLTDVLVVPSYSEGMPNVIMEGMASGCAIIGTDVGAVNSLVNQNNGWLIPPNNQKALQTAIIDAITLESNLMEEKKVNARNYIQKGFLWNDIALRTQKELEKIISKRISNG